MESAGSSPRFRLHRAVSLRQRQAWNCHNERWLTQLIAASRRAPGVDSASLAALETFLFERTEEMHGALQGCERPQRTPSPPGYAVILRRAMACFLATLSLVLLAIGFGMVPISVRRR